MQVGKKILPWKFLHRRTFWLQSMPKDGAYWTRWIKWKQHGEKTASKTWKKIFYIYIQWDAITFYWKSISVCFCKVLVCSVFLPYLDCKLLLLYIFYEFFSFSLSLSFIPFYFVCSSFVGFLKVLRIECHIVWICEYIISCAANICLKLQLIRFHGSLPVPAVCCAHICIGNLRIVQEFRSFEYYFDWITTFCSEHFPNYY